MDYRYLGVGQFAQTYGDGAYGSGTYTCQEENCDTQTSVGAPNTGFIFNQPPAIAIPSLVALAIFIATLTYAISRKLKKRNQ